ncbi:nucleoside-diphosphate kinase [Natranaerobius thermophilus]|uniref:Nucleoside diphosphate kinase n=1 Tax=Natranaerobius thermophilus (strain ATCC BAA-1301 / DSM 18059 / JW/NM-WN-LF) TaxID=457570 RepID=B2A4K4_NATTJ|nr:nucleoside-diphosphate kinase [Natranaerobius thermophilus]ACB85179.1 nucleoside diphosphate kinase [Natranaerobius thermophilus JW/NM-WN-LF]
MSSQNEQTFVMVKPDGVERGLVGEIISRLENKRLNLRKITMLEVSKELAQTHYQEHRDKPFFNDLINYITSGPVVAMVWEGDNVIEVVRKLIGDTDPKKAAPGTIRGDLALDITYNLVHGSDSEDTAKREINLFFRPTN